MDLGECRKLHDVALRADYENALKKKDYYYDIDVNTPHFFLNTDFLMVLVRDNTRIFPCLSIKIYF